MGNSITKFVQVGQESDQQRFGNQDTSFGQDALLETCSQRSKIQIFECGVICRSFAKGNLPRMLALVQVNRRDSPEWRFRKWQTLWAFAFAKRSLSPCVDIIEV